MGVCVCVCAVQLRMGTQPFISRLSSHGIQACKTQLGSKRSRSFHKAAGHHEGTERLSLKHIQTEQGSNKHSLFRLCSQNSSRL